LATVISNATTSLVSLVITVVVGRQEGLSELGVFGIGFAALGLAQLLSREIGVNTAWASRSPQARPRALSRVLVASLLVCLALIAAAGTVGSVTLGFTGAAVIGFCLYDFARLWEISQGNRSRVAFTDAVLCFGVVTVAGAVVWSDAASGWLLATWALLLLVLGIWHARRWKPLWSVAGLRESSGWSFGPQAVLGAGSAHMSTMLLGLVSTAAVIGEIKAASTLFGIVNVLSVTLQSVVIQDLSERKERGRTLKKWFVLSVALQVALAAVTAALSLWLGPLIFGDSWGTSSRLVAWLAVDVIFVAIGVCAVAAHKVDREAKSATAVALAGGLLRIGLVPFAGFLGDALSVVAVLTMISGVSSLLWWVSYARYRRKVT